jgi:Polyketide cyclase / dehydrase and lipid transport
MVPIKRNLLATSFVVGVAYGLTAYFAFSSHAALPTIAFLVAVPLALGAIPLLLSDLDQVRSYAYVLLIPWLTIFTVFAVLIALLKEGALCILVLGAPFWGMALVGTLVGAVVRAVLISRRKRQAAAAALMLLPFALVGLEKQHLVHEERVSVASAVVVDAPAEQVFGRLAEVETLQDDEYHPGFFNRIGVPRPVRATVDRKAVGGHRTGVFTRGVEFQEVIEVYDPPRRMAFDIAVDPGSLAPNSTERHALEGGYFRFVDATYELAPRSDGRVTLTLTSTYVAKSSVDAYGELWANVIVGDFQDRVLAVIKRRCELPQAAEPAEVAASR